MGPFKKNQTAPLPPGPPGLPLIGNLKDMPQSRAHETFTEWGRKYGGIVHIKVLGLHIIILSDYKYIHGMLESKGQLYSNRPTLMMAGQMVGWDQSPVLIQSNETWSEYRRLMAQFMDTSSKVEAFGDVIEEEVGELLTRLVAKPQEHFNHFETYTGSVFLRLVYGYKARSEDDPFVKAVNDAMQGFSQMTQSGAFAVDLFPILRYVPDWFPGASWKGKAVKYRDGVNKMLQLPYEWTRKQMTSGTARPCFVKEVLEKEELTADREDIVQWTAAGLHAGGALTTAAALSWFLLAIIRHPNEARRAQAEIDAYVGHDRLPTLADRYHLPYFEALCMEIHRLYPVGNLGLQHVPREDDIHDGYFIPKGSIVIPNNSLLYLDEKMYPNPERFFPDRFLEIDVDGRQKQKDPRDYLFGYGPRVCPGVHLAKAMQWVACATLITAFEIKPIVKDGEFVIPPANVQEGLVNIPKSFEYVIAPRPNFSSSSLRES